MSEELQQMLRTKLWIVANTLRGNMSASDFMYFTLGFIFYKYLSEKIELEADSMLAEDNIKFKDLWASDDEDLKEELKQSCIEELGYFIEPEYLYSTIIAMAVKKENILPNLERSLKRIEDSTTGQRSSEDFSGLFSDIDLTSPKLGKTADDKNKLISEVLIALDGIDFKLEDANEIDILGDAYEYMIGQFAAGAGKKAGEFYTPQEVSQILSDIVTTGKTRLRNVYDPTCGSGSLLLRTAKEGKADQIFGQEKNPTTYNLARMNMLLHGVKDSEFEIHHGDSLANDWDLLNDENPSNEIKFDAIVANPPFSLRWDPTEDTANDFRFSRHGIAPKSAADFAFLLHGFHYLDDNGTMAIILPHGVLFRGGKELAIRKKLLEDDNIDAVIGLPANLFYSTGIPVCIIVLKKCRKNDKILFINASSDEHYEKDKRQNKLRDEDVNKIIDTYQYRYEEPRYSRQVSLQEIKENDYNLNITRYVSLAKEEDPVDLLEVSKQLQSIEDKIEEARNKHNVFLNELGLPELP